MAITPKEEKAIRIATLIDVGFSLKKISRKLKIPYSTVKKVAAKYHRTGSVARRRGSGRPKKMDEEDRELIITKIRESPKTSAPELANYLLEEKGKNVSSETIRSTLHTEELISAVAAVKPLLTPTHMARRLAFAKDWLMKPFRYFKHVIFSDESRFKLFQSDGKSRVWRYEGTRYDLKNCSPSVKF